MRIFLGLWTQLGHHKWRLYPKRRLYDRICASCANCSPHAVHVYVSWQENQCWEAGFQRIAPQIARSLFACPSQELIARENFLDWLQSGVEASTALSEWTGGAGVLPSLNACRCLRWKPWRLGTANFTDACRRRRLQSMSWPYTADKVRGKPFCFKVAALDRWDAPLVAARAMRRSQPRLCVCVCVLLCILNAVSFNRFSAYIVETQETHRHR